MGQGDNVVSFRRWAISEEDRAAIKSFIDGSRWRLECHECFADDDTPFVVFEYVESVLTFQIGPHIESGLWAIIGSDGRVIGHGTSISECLNGFRMKTAIGG